MRSIWNSEITKALPVGRAFVRPKIKQLLPFVALKMQLSALFFIGPDGWSPAGPSPCQRSRKLAISI